MLFSHIFDDFIAIESTRIPIVCWKLLPLDRRKKKLPKNIEFEFVYLFFCSVLLLQYRVSTKLVCIPAHSAVVSFYFSLASLCSCHVRGSSIQIRRELPLYSFLISKRKQKQIYIFDNLACISFAFIATYGNGSNVDDVALTYLFNSFYAKIDGACSPLCRVNVESVRRVIWRCFHNEYWFQMRQSNELLGICLSLVLGANALIRLRLDFWADQFNWIQFNISFAHSIVHRFHDELTAK